VARHAQQRTGSRTDARSSIVTVRRVPAVAAVGAGLATTDFLLARTLADEPSPCAADESRTECPWPIPKP
jgi:hypothetical protein